MVQITSASQPCWCKIFQIRFVCQCKSENCLAKVKLYNSPKICITNVHERLALLLPSLKDGNSDSLSSLHLVLEGSLVKQQKAQLLTTDVCVYVKYLNALICAEMSSSPFGMVCAGSSLEIFSWANSALEEIVCRGGQSLPQVMGWEDPREQWVCIVSWLLLSEDCAKSCCTEGEWEVFKAWWLLQAHSSVSELWLHFDFFHRSKSWDGKKFPGSKMKIWHPNSTDALLPRTVWLSVCPDITQNVAHSREGAFRCLQGICVIKAKCIWSDFISCLMLETSAAPRICLKI